MIAVICPTIPGREESLERTIRSYDHEADTRVVVWEDSPSSGEGWRRGLERFVEWHGEPDYVHFTNDDCELIGRLSDARAVCDGGALPAPIVRNGDGTLQSAGGRLGAAEDLIREIGPDRCEVGFTTIPFMSWVQWERIGMLEIHYSSDVWVSERGRQLGVPTVLCHGYEFVHYMHQVGRGAGMSQADRSTQDKALMKAALAEH